MIRWFMRATPCLLILLATTPEVLGQDAGAERALSGLVERWVSARNGHDAEAMRGIFHPNVDQIRLSNGELIATDQDALVRWFEAGFKGDGRNTRARVDSTRLRVLSPDTGLADFSFTLQGADGRPVATGHSTFVCARDDTGWKVVAVRFGSAPAK